MSRKTQDATKVSPYSNPAASEASDAPSSDAPTRDASVEDLTDSPPEDGEITDWTGRVVGDKYEMTRLLGQGAMGSVWKARHRLLKSEVAVKLINPHLAKHTSARQRFLREAQAAAALRSPNVVQILDFGFDGEVPFIVMEMLQGETLGARIARQKRLSTSKTLTIITQVARAIAKAHAAGIIHRDLKPDNVFITRADDDEEIVKVLDFGVAKVSEGTTIVSDSDTRTGALVGSPHYMSPEQAEGSKHVDYRSDLWAMAIITYECLIGDKPFEGAGLGSLLAQIMRGPNPVPSKERPGLPRSFDVWFGLATQRNPEERFQSAKEMARDLRDALDVDDERGSFGSISTYHVAPEVIKNRKQESFGTMRAVEVSDSTTGAQPTPQPANKLTLLLGAVALLALGWLIGYVFIVRPSADTTQAPTAPAAQPVAAPVGTPAPAPAKPAPEPATGEPAPSAAPVGADAKPNKAAQPKAPAPGKPKAHDTDDGAAKAPTPAKTTKSPLDRRL